MPELIISLRQRPFDRRRTMRNGSNDDRERLLRDDSHLMA